MVERGHGRPHRGWLDWRQGTRKIPPVPQAWGGGSGAAADGGAIAASQPLHHPADVPPPHALRAQGGSITRIMLPLYRTSVVYGTSVSVRVVLGGRRIIKNKT